MLRRSFDENLGTEPGVGRTDDEPVTQSPRVRQILGGKYRLVSVLGEGNMGVVWLAEHLALRSPVALKLLLPSGEREPDARACFLREARIASALRSPHVVQVFDYGVDNGTAYIAMERLEGESLARRLERLGSLGAEETVRVIAQVARALGRAHELGIVHRDLKPDNIFIVDDDDREIVKLLDFGIATEVAARGPPGSKGAATAGFVGTPQYMSPEQAECAASVDGRTDIWALGVIAFECLIGHPPFVGDTVARILLAMRQDPLPVPSAQGAVPRAFDAWFQRACARDVTRRFASARAAADQLERLFAAIETDRASSAPQPAPSPERRGGFLAALARRLIES
jgi:eukaryotic-like serine/threonine-protein kinase